MPSLGADMTAGTLVAWKIKPGDTVARGQVVAEVETDKGVIDVECFDVGIVEKILAVPGQKLPVGAVMAVIAGATESVKSGRLRRRQSRRPSHQLRISLLPGRTE